MKKRLLSLFLALTMIVSLFTGLTVTASAASSLAGVSIEEGTPKEYSFLRNNNEGSIKKNVGDTGFYQRLPRNTQIHQYCGRTLVELIPEYYAGVSYELSNPDVLSNCGFSVEYSKISGYTDCPCLQFNYTAAKAGTTNVTLTFYYNYNYYSEIGNCSYCGRYAQTQTNTTWYKETTTFTVTVEGAHEHSYTAAVTQDPTCTTPGVRTYTCECGDFYTEEISALGHDWGNWTVNKEPTYFEKGEQVRECQRENCDAVETEEIDRLVPPTSFGDLFINVNANSNIVKAYCGVNHWDYFKKADLDGCYTVNDLVFDETEGVWKATVTLDGYAIAEKYSAKYPKQGVHYVKDGSEVKVLTATFGQTEKWTLKYNNVLLNKATITVNMTCKPTCAHEWVEGVVTVEPTCTKDGIITYSCAHCEKTRQSAIAALGHDWDDGVVVKEPTVEEAGILRFSCSRCDEIRDVEITVSKPEAPTAAELKELCWFPDATYSFQVKDHNYKNNYTGIKNDQVVDECFGEFGKIYYDEKAELWKVDVELNASFFVDLFNRTYGSDAVSYKLYKNNVITICFDEARGWYADQTQFPAVVYVVK